MSEQRSSYRQIMKATSIFGGVQVFQIGIKVVTSKFIAILLGPLGMGISGLLISTTNFVAALTNFGLSTSAVKDIAAAHATGNETKIRTTVTIFRRIVWYTGSLGTLVTLILSPWLSQITFGNREYTYAFMLISITLLINQISAGQSVLLRGMRQIRYLAKAGVMGSVLGLFTTIPLYYFFGIDGIVPGIIVTAVTALLLTWYFGRKLNVKPMRVSRLRILAEGKGMLKMGFMISLSSLITLGASYIVRIFISNTGGVDQVGLYAAGFTIINTYVGMVFSAMSTDYYPRLSAVAYDNEKSKNVINQQSEIALLILAPIIMVFLVFINWVVIILYSNRFLPVNDMILYAAIGMYFKAASWAIGFIFLAKGASRLYFWNELIANVYLLGLNLLGYKYFGLAGMGVSFLLSYLLYLVQVYLVSKIKFGFSFDTSFLKIFFPQLLLVIVCFLAVKLIPKPGSYFVGIVVILVSSFLSYKEMDKRIAVRQIVSKISRRK